VNVVYRRRPTSPSPSNSPTLLPTIYNNNNNNNIIIHNIVYYYYSLRRRRLGCSAGPTPYLFRVLSWRLLRRRRRYPAVSITSPLSYLITTTFTYQRLPNGRLVESVSSVLRVGRTRRPTSAAPAVAAPFSCEYWYLIKHCTIFT